MNRNCKIPCPDDEVLMVRHAKRKMTYQCCFLCLLSPELQIVIKSDIRLLKLSVWGDCRGSLLPDLHHMIGEPGSESTAPSLLRACLSLCLHSCTEQLYTRLSTWPVFLVFVSIKKILHLYLQQLNRGQLSTCVVWWWVSEFDASRGGEAFKFLFFLSFSFFKKKKTNKTGKPSWLLKLHHATINKGVV